MSKIFGSLVFIFIGLAWLSPFHMNPWLTASSEILTFLSLFSLIIFFKDRELNLQKEHLFFLGVSIIPLVQYSLGIIFFFETALLCFCYLFCAGLCFIYGSNVKLEEIQHVKKNLFTLLFFIASIIALFGFVQFLGLERGIWFITPLNNSERIYSNFSQPNNMATFLNMGFISAIWLLIHRKISFFLYALISSLIIFCIFFSYSRVGLIGLSLILFSTFIYLIYKKYEKKNIYAILSSALLLFLIIFLKEEIIFIFNYFGVGLDSKFSLQDRFSNVGGRSTMWVQMLYAIKENPLLGYGWNQTAIAQINAANFAYHFEQTRSAHNVFLDILIWNGNILGSIIVFSLIIILLKFFSSKKGDFFLKLIIVIFCIHALLEFPQNYAYFLFFVCFIIGLVLNSNYNIKLIKIDKCFNLIFLFLFSVIFSFVIRDYLNYKFILINYTKEDYKNNIINEKLIVLDRLDTLLGWVLVEKNNINEINKIHNYSKFVMTAPTEYNLLNIMEIHKRNNLTKEFNEFCGYYVNLYKKECK
ncbi:PglL family O-oligosaccharyltransferase [Acinetobacter sp. YH1901136]|uniref:PglL family O-oligosaccharyltransferase n=1 Tax=Acinetobacter sp. YH1901136 TaxID=2601200 RepID=UPI0015D3ECFC|nr:Wzy polymerase domain-containing protein [Acinetobacter sp. YH1901136]